MKPSMLRKDGALAYFGLRADGDMSDDGAMFARWRGVVL